MLDNELKSYLLPNLFNAAVRAGAAIMQVYKNKEDYDISIKSDKTPITVADRRAHETIKTYLGPTRIPILSEEGREMRYEERCNWAVLVGGPAGRNGGVYQGKQRVYGQYRPDGE